MSGQQYEVLYIDKFTDVAVAEYAKENIRKLFHLDQQHMDRLSTGEPVVIKKHVNQQQAEKYKQAIAKAGGVAWAQCLDENGQHRERRQSSRRRLLDRRGSYRASSIQPDRRESCGRRSTDGLPTINRAQAFLGATH